MQMSTIADVAEMYFARARRGKMEKNASWTTGLGSTFASFCRANRFFMKIRYSMGTRFCLENPSEIRKNVNFDEV